MTNPIIQQGVLNKASVHVVVVSNNALNVLYYNLGKDMVSAHPTGPASTYIDTAAGRVPSPEPYIPYDVSIDILKTTGAYANWFAAMQKSSYIGDIQLIGDTSALPVITISNCSIVNPGDLLLNATKASTVISLTGLIYVNNSMWNA